MTQLAGTIDQWEKDGLSINVWEQTGQPSETKNEIGLQPHPIVKTDFQVD